MLLFAALVTSALSEIDWSTAVDHVFSWLGLGGDGIGWLAEICRLCELCAAFQMRLAKMYLVLSIGINKKVDFQGYQSSDMEGVALQLSCCPRMYDCMSRMR